MKSVVIVAVSCGALVAAFSLGRHSRSERRFASELTSVDSFRRALEDRDDLRRAYRLGVFFEGLDADNVTAVLSAIEAIETRGGRLSDEELRLLMFAWTRFDAAGAFDYALFSVPGKDRRRAIGAAIYAWAFRDSVAATFKMKGAPLEGFVEGRVLAGRIHAGEIEAVSRDLRSIAPGERRRDLAEVAADELASQSPSALIDWAESLIEAEHEGGDEAFERSVYAGSVAALFRIDKERAAAWVAEHVGEAYASGVARFTAANWMRSDPESALEWLAGLEAGSERLEALHACFGSWYELEPKRAVSWLRDHTPNPVLDPAVKTVAMRAMAASPVDAIEWASRIGDKGRRERVLVSIGKAWMTSDPEAARRWMTASGLPQAARRAITRSTESVR